MSNLNGPEWQPSCTLVAGSAEHRPIDAASVQGKVRWKSHAAPFAGDEVAHDELFLQHVFEEGAAVAVPEEIDVVAAVAEAVASKAEALRTGAAWRVQVVGG